MRCLNQHLLYEVDVPLVTKLAEVSRVSLKPVESIINFVPLTNIVRLGDRESLDDVGLVIFVLLLAMGLGEKTEVDIDARPDRISFRCNLFWVEL